MNCIPIGYAHTSFKTLKETPLSSTDVHEEATIEILPEFRKCIKGLEENKFLYILCWLHESKRDVLEVHRRHDTTKPLTGVFNSRSPERPNPISLTFVELVNVKEDSIVVKHLDALDGTPVIDIKPYLIHYDTE
ncbi:S-adenosyl-L-methionine-binding protein [Tritrichomonas foetus]|uniref:S-adenosyl-L-methionine-binding protein n=1 Tax=Tritrichomonas foetus TaxID=1144522 RepID=A0A1J4L399_9EUKA|nr:S-adenosyl-L-methionine-binding protein [Tritrichomonas foetus]|eukprot:OHT16389.1 S-adenosyl-L-methionine-binding protein [Tritrichomonas foetus]